MKGSQEIGIKRTRTIENDRMGAEKSIENRNTEDGVIFKGERM